MMMFVRHHVVQNNANVSQKTRPLLSVTVCPLHLEIRKLAFTCSRVSKKILFVHNWPPNNPDFIVSNSWELRRDYQVLLIVDTFAHLTVKWSLHQQNRNSNERKIKLRVTITVWWRTREGGGHFLVVGPLHSSLIFHNNDGIQYIYQHTAHRFYLAYRIILSCCWR